MSMILSILIAVSLNILPAGTNAFTIEMPDGMGANKMVRLTRQPEGWHAVALPDFELGTFAVKGSALTVKRAGKESTQDLAQVLGLGPETDWGTVKELRFGGMLMKVERVADGVNLTLDGKDAQGREVVRTFKARWTVPAK